MSAIHFTPEAEALVTELAIDRGAIEQTIRHPDAVLTDKQFETLACLRWLDADRALFLSCGIAAGLSTPDRQKLAITEVVVRLALWVGSTLPAGQLVRGADMETMLALIAESFGLPVRCHPEEPWSTLYSGPTARYGPHTPFEVLHGTWRGDVLICGCFRPNENYAEYCWAFSLDKYRAWYQHQPPAV